MRFQVQIYQDEDGAFISECPSIPGCVSQGKDLNEALVMIKDAIEGCLETRKELGMSLYLPTYEVEVAIPV
jgi:predicted RNase H-like HicB family nuclease